MVGPFTFVEPDVQGGHRIKPDTGKERIVEQSVNGPLIITVFFGLMMAWTALLCAFALRSSRAFGLKLPLIAGTLACQTGATFCLFGTVASFEPGVYLAWRIGYGMGMLLFLVGAAALSAKLVNRTGRSVPTCRGDQS